MSYMGITVFRNWLTQNCIFPNSMVDRITPATTSLRVSPRFEKAEYRQCRRLVILSPRPFLSFGR